MFVGSPKALTVAGMALAVVFASPAQAQSNPFLPASAASKANVEKIVEEKMRALEERLNASMKKANEAGAPNGLPGGPAVPGAIPNGPSGANVPGGMTPPGMMPPGALPHGIPGAPDGMPLAPVEPPKGVVEAAIDDGMRFVGCINGVPKFSKRNGQRLVFKQADINDAIKTGLIPACR